MKRIKSACICQTIHFMHKDGLSTEFNRRQVQSELENYKKSLIKAGTKHKIVEENVQEDGSVIVKVIKQYNTSPVGDYLD